jgi:hypothetical protein
MVRLRTCPHNARVVVEIQPRKDLKSASDMFYAAFVLADAIPLSSSFSGPGQGHVRRGTSDGLSRPSLHFDKASLLGAMDVLNFRETRLLAQNSL